MGIGVFALSSSGINITYWRTRDILLQLWKKLGFALPTRSLKVNASDYGVILQAN
ncbi:hypothetical protein L208DRAFT_1414405 [Tricholoma matsutake]|nr:hypothetical protein L208DRAFT_1414405 [Tricholoma matsutake 945]